MSGETQPRCANCGAVVQERDRYCAACGARAIPERLTFKSIVAGSVEHLFNFDLPLLRTFVDLFRFPGRVAREYVDGRRKFYISPLKYNLITAALLVGVVHVILSGQAPTLPKGVQSAAVPKLVSDAIALSLKWNNDYLQIMYLLSLPALALLLRGMLGWRCGRNVMEFYVMCLFGFGQIYLIQGTCILIATWLPRWGLDIMFGVISGLSPFVYMPWITVGFCRRGIVLEAIFSLVAFFVFSLFVSALLFAVACGYLWLTQ